MAPSNHNSQTETENNNNNNKKKIKAAESSKNGTKLKKEKEPKINEEKKAQKIKEVKNKDQKIKEVKQKNKKEINKEQGKKKEEKEKKKEEEQKNITKEKEKKKHNLSNGNGNLKQHHDDKQLIAPCSTSKVHKHDLKQEKVRGEYNAIAINGGTKPKKLKPKRKDHEEEGEEEEGDAKTHAFPINRIRTVIKGEDPDVRVSHEAIIAINKATEKFLEQFTQEAYTRCVQDRKKALSYMHLAYVVSKERRYDFLSDFVPGKVKAEDALRERNSGGNGGG